MAIYKNNDEKSIFASIDFDDTNNTAFFFVKSEADVEKAQKMLVDAGETFVAKSYVKGQTVLIAQSKEPRDRTLEKIASLDCGKFDLDKEDKKTSLQFIKENGWKIRGGSSVIGQSATLLSAAKSLSKVQIANGQTKPTFDPAMGYFAIFNLAANFINYVFGGQKEEDVHGLEKFDKIIAEEVNRYLPTDKHNKISPEDVRKLSYMNDKEVEEHNKDRSPTGMLKRNSVWFGEVGLRTLGSISMMLPFNIKNYKDGFSKLTKGNFKGALSVTRSKDPITFVAGMGMVSGKIMGLLSKTYDPNNPPKTYWEEIRQKVLWPVSSYTEMIAQSATVYNSHKNKKLILGGKQHYDYAGVGGNALLTVPPYPTRLVLPYGQKVLDVDEVQARLLDELHKLPQDKIPEVAARITARMVEHMRGNAPEFSELYRKLMSKLDKYHDIDVLPHGVDPKSAEKVSSKAADSTPSGSVSEVSAHEKAQAEVKTTDKPVKADKTDSMIKDMSMVGKLAGADAAASEAAMAR